MAGKNAFEMICFVSGRM